MAETYEFPTPLHSLANKHYGHFPDGTVANVNFILFHIDGEKLDTLYNTYSNGTQFTRGAQIEEQWNKWYTEYEEQLSGTSNRYPSLPLEHVWLPKGKENESTET